MKHII